MKQRTEEWFAIRLGKFSSSEWFKLLVKSRKAEEALGETAKTYIMEKLAERLTGQRVEIFVTKPIQRGIDKEPEARAEFERRTGLKVDEIGFIPLVDYENYAGGSPDGIINNRDAIIEIKCPNTYKHLETLVTKKIPKKDYSKYYTQMQMNMAVTFTNKCYFISYDDRIIDPKKQMVIIEIPRDDEYIQKCRDALDLAIKELAHLYGLTE